MGNVQIIETQCMEDYNALFQFSKTFIPENIQDFGLSETHIIFVLSSKIERNTEHQSILLKLVEKVIVAFSSVIYFY